MKMPKIPKCLCSNRYCKNYDRRKLKVIHKYQKTVTNGIWNTNKYNSFVFFCEYCEGITKVDIPD